MLISSLLHTLCDVSTKLAGSQGLFIGYATVPWNRVARLPEGFPSKYGACLLQGLTALTALKESYEVQKGDWILVHAIAGGLGLQFCQVSTILQIYAFSGLRAKLVVDGFHVHIDRQGAGCQCHRHDVNG